jgi:hypothetical protein
MEAWIEDAAHPTCAPPGFIEWARRFATASDSWETCPRAEWRLWLAALLARAPDEQLHCAKAALHVARRLAGLWSSSPAQARAAIESAEQWAVTRRTDDEHFERLEAIKDWTGTPLGEVGSLVVSAAWFADFEACVGIDAACNAMDLFASADALARHLGDAAFVDRVFVELNGELKTMLFAVVAAIPGPRPEL